LSVAATAASSSLFFLFFSFFPSTVVGVIRGAVVVTALCAGVTNFFAGTAGVPSLLSESSEEDSSEDVSSSTAWSVVGAAA
jgi:hypothetical protein